GGAGGDLVELLGEAGDRRVHDRARAGRTATALGPGGALHSTSSAPTRAPSSGPPPAGKPLPLRSSLHLSDGMAGYLRPARRPPAWLLAPLWQRVHLRPLGRRRLTVPEHVGEQTVARHEPARRGAARQGGRE